MACDLIYVFYFSRAHALMMEDFRFVIKRSHVGLHREVNKNVWKNSMECAICVRRDFSADAHFHLFSTIMAMLCKAHQIRLELMLIRMMHT